MILACSLPFSGEVGYVSSIVGIIVVALGLTKWLWVKRPKIKRRPLLLYVSTGGTCRDPIAKAITLHLLGALSNKIIIQSAGTLGEGGKRATPAARQIVVDTLATDYLDKHHSVELNQEKIDEAALVLAMGKSNKEQILKNLERTEGKVFTIKEFLSKNGDIRDPFRGDDVSSVAALGRYRQTFHELYDLLKQDDNYQRIYRATIEGHR